MLASALWGCSPSYPVVETLSAVTPRLDPPYAAASALKPGSCYATLHGP